MTAPPATGRGCGRDAGARATSASSETQRNGAYSHEPGSKIQRLCPPGELGRTTEPAARVPLLPAGEQEVVAGTDPGRDRAGRGARDHGGSGRGALHLHAVLAVRGPAAGRPAATRSTLGFASL